MKLGMACVAMGIISLIALVIFLAMSLIVGDAASGIGVTIGFGIAGSMFLYKGIKRIKKPRDVITGFHA